MSDYREEAYSDAKSIIEDNMEAVTDAICGPYGKVDAYRDLPDSAVDEIADSNGYLNPGDAVELLTELDKYEETDSGLWSGLDWRDTLRSIAAFTYRNAVAAFLDEILDAINEAVDDWEPEKPEPKDEDEDEEPEDELTPEQAEALVNEVLEGF